MREQWQFFTNRERIHDKGKILEEEEIGMTIIYQGDPQMIVLMEMRGILWGEAWEWIQLLVILLWTWVLPFQWIPHPILCRIGPLPELIGKRVEAVGGDPMIEKRGPVVGIARVEPATAEAVELVSIVRNVPRVNPKMIDDLKGEKAVEVGIQPQQAEAVVPLTARVITLAAQIQIVMVTVIMITVPQQVAPNLLTNAATKNSVGGVILPMMTREVRRKEEM